ncbi:PREDICTED: uncharacterized protein LOC107073388 [Polistes dominula]|uniref:Uncharacterized protein LOC107073388 n=1 Tax=Polistes dominula TaxID=743375 RepID=A0ABM1JAL4_POLDO|nr:PREDICTED: uncharacterized protein LOC107073388 [Polistes dominula]
MQLHGFCDASQSGYGGCLYVISRDEFLNTHVRLLCVKSRVAPLKDTTIPRIELREALTLARLYREVRTAGGLKPDEVTFWSDSMIVLGWLKRDFNNPADALSRGQLPHDFLRNEAWFHGPPWLTQPETQWSIPTERKILELPDVKGLSVLTTRTKSGSVFQRFSNYARLLKIVARCRRWLETNSYKGELSTAEKTETERYVLRIVQEEQFHAEREKLKKAGGVSNTKLAALNPILVKDYLYQVGGRFRRQIQSFQEKYTKLLLLHYHMIDLLIRKFHERNFHAGIQTTLYALKQRFWLIDCKNRVIRCKTGDLLSSRVQEAIAFSHVEENFFGLIYAKEKKYCNKGRGKKYGCIFVCMTIKAVHIELVSDLTTDAFLAAFRRFVSQRAVPTHVYSNNGTNFVWANNQLKKLYALIESDKGLLEAAVKSFNYHFRRNVGELLFAYEEPNDSLVGTRRSPGQRLSGYAEQVSGDMLSDSANMSSVLCYKR